MMMAWLHGRVLWSLLSPATDVFKLVVKHSILWQDQESHNRKKNTTEKDFCFFGTSHAFITAWPQEMPLYWNSCSAYTTWPKPHQLNLLRRIPRRHTSTVNQFPPYQPWPWWHSATLILIPALQNMTNILFTHKYISTWHSTWFTFTNSLMGPRVSFAFACHLSCGMVIGNCAFWSLTVPDSISLASNTSSTPRPHTVLTWQGSAVGHSRMVNYRTMLT